MKIVQISYNKGGSSQEFVTRPGVKLNSLPYVVASIAVEEEEEETPMSDIYELLKSFYPEILSYNKVTVPGSDVYGAVGLFLEQFFMTAAPTVTLAAGIRNLSWMFCQCFRLQDVPAVNWEDGVIPDGLSLSCMFSFGGVSSMDQYAELLLKELGYTTGLSSITSVLPLIEKSNRCEYMFSMQPRISVPQVSFSFNGEVHAESMFAECKFTEFGEIIISDATTLIVAEFFSGCTALTTVGRIDFSRLREIESMFGGCTALTHIDVTGIIDENLKMSSSANLDDATLLAICYATGQSQGTLTFNTALSAKADNHVKFGDDTLVFCESTDPESQGTLASFMTLKGWTLAFD